MPFTFCHPAIVLPLNYLPRKWISLTGLVVGSITPDFEYFLRMRVLSNFSHTLHGLFWFDLPFGLLLAFAFHALVKNPLIDNLPGFLKSRFVVFKGFNWSFYFKENWFVVLLSILIGAGSHLFWDAFTHDNGYFVQKIELIRKNIVLFGIHFPIYKIFQHLSSLFGALIIIFAVMQLPIKPVVKIKSPIKYWLICVAITLLIVLVRVLIGVDLIFIGHLLITGMAAMLISLIVTSLLIKYID